MKSETNQPMQVVNRALDLLELLASESTPIQTTDIAERLGVSAQNANNLLRVLFRRGYVSQDQSRRYRLGPQLCIFGDATARWERLRKVMEPVLINLNRTSGFGAFAGVLENDRLYCFAHILPNGEPATREYIRHVGAVRVLLAALSSRERKKLFARKTRREITAKAVTDPAELAKICLDIQKAGYAEMKEESRDGICSIAVPVRDFSGTVIAGLGLYGPTATWETTTSAQKKALMKSCLDLLEK